jgi:histidinol-phosphate aminotransferase
VPLADIAESFFKPAVRDIVPYEPGKPVEEVQRELGLDRVIKLASNEGPFGPFPEALDALAEAAPELNRYPDGGAYRLRAALAERHGVELEEIALGAGADGVVDCLAQVSLDPGDEIVCGWPSFPSYVIGARKLGAEAKTIPLDDGRYDLDAIRGAVTERTKLVYVCHPNNPTGTMNTREELDAYFDRVPDHVLTVLDQAYFEYVDDPDYADGIEEYLKRGRRVVVLRFVAHSTSRRRRRLRRSRAWARPAHPRRSSGAAASTARGGPRSRRRSESTASIRSAPRWRTSSSLRSGTTPGRCSSGFSRRA